MEQAVACPSASRRGKPERHPGMSYGKPERPRSSTACSEITRLTMLTSGVIPISPFMEQSRCDPHEGQTLAQKSPSGLAVGRRSRLHGPSSGPARFGYARTNVLRLSHQCHRAAPDTGSRRLAQRSTLPRLTFAPRLASPGRAQGDNPRHRSNSFRLYPSEASRCRGLQWSAQSRRRAGPQRGQA